MADTPADAFIDTNQIEQEFKEFTYIISHDLSAPLRTVVEFSRLLNSEYADKLDGEAKEYLGLITEGGLKLQTMLQGLLDYSRLNTMAKPPSLVNCNTILADCQLVLKNEMKAKKAVLEIGTLPTVKADAEQLMQLFLILLNNALKFNAGNPPRINIGAEQNDAYWIFSIRDNGIGIPAEFYDRIFKPFQRLHTESEYEGIGMGLSLAKKIAERHGGRVWVESVLGKGSCFMFSIPLHGI
jgi:chemotaxis family two-component system sensor kinase Cph1